MEFAIFEAMQKMNKEIYRSFCQTNKGLSIFNQDWWLDTLCEDNWDVALVHNQGQVIAAFPYIIKRKMKYTFLVQPFLTPHFQLYLAYPPEQKTTSRLSFEKEKIAALIEQLPPFDLFEIQFNPSFTNWLPFYWNNFAQTTRYTYQLHNIKNEDNLWNALKENIRREIKKAKNKTKIVEGTLAPFYKLLENTMIRQNFKVGYSFKQLEKLDTVLKQKQKRKIYFALDENNNCHAAAYIVWDTTTAYYLMGATDDKFRNSGAQSFILWTAIKECSVLVNTFDFEGSMLPFIERFFSAFGAKQIPYFKISKSNSKTLELLKKIKKQK